VPQKLSLSVKVFLQLLVIFHGKSLLVVEEGAWDECRLLGDFEGGPMVSQSSPLAADVVVVDATD
jgi:hypothetical protein